MARRGTRILNGYVKWILIPLAMGAIGFFFVGPRLSSLPPSVAKKLQEVVPTKGTSTKTTEEGETKKFAEPDVEVSETPSTKGKASNKRTLR